MTWHCLESSNWLYKSLTIIYKFYSIAIVAMLGAIKVLISKIQVCSGRPIWCISRSVDKNSLQNNVIKINKIHTEIMVTVNNSIKYALSFPSSLLLGGLFLLLIHWLTVDASASFCPNQCSIFTDTSLHSWSTSHQFPSVLARQICLWSFRAVPFDPPGVVLFVSQLLVVPRPLQLFVCLCTWYGKLKHW